MQLSQDPLYCFWGFFSLSALELLISGHFAEQTNVQHQFPLFSGSHTLPHAQNLDEPTTAYCVPSGCSTEAPEVKRLT